MSDASVCRCCKLSNSNLPMASVDILYIDITRRWAASTQDSREAGHTPTQTHGKHSPKEPPTHAHHVNLPSLMLIYHARLQCNNAPCPYVQKSPIYKQFVCLPRPYNH